MQPSTGANNNVWLWKAATAKQLILLTVCSGRFFIRFPTNCKFVSVFPLDDACSLLKVLQQAGQRQ